MKLAAMLSVRDGKAAVAFYAAAFGSTAVIHAEDDDGRVVAELRAGDAHFWLADESPDNGNFAPPTVGGSTTRMLLRVEDPEAMVARALAAGAREVYAVEDAHGWRLGRVEDPFGHHWEIGKPLIDWPPK
jgi:PhnB protein